MGDWIWAEDQGWRVSIKFLSVVRLVCILWNGEAGTCKERDKTSEHHFITRVEILLNTLNHYLFIMKNSETKNQL